MSTLRANEIIGANGGALLKSTGNIVQVQRFRTDTIQTWTSSGSTPTEVTNLRLTIAPKFSNSLLVMFWTWCGEMSNHNTVWRIFRNGSVITDSGYQGYNIESGQSTWSGFFTGDYDQDQASTPRVNSCLYIIPAGSTTSRNYGLAFVGSNATNRTYYQNRCVSSAGQNSYENGIATGIIYEVKQ